MQAKRKIPLWQKKAPIYKLSRSKAPTTQQICHYKHARKTTRLFYCTTGALIFSSYNNLANLSSFAKVSVPVQSVIPRSKGFMFWELWHSVINTITECHNSQNLIRAFWLVFGIKRYLMFIYLNTDNMVLQNC